MIKNFNLSSRDQSLQNNTHHFVSPKVINSEQISHVDSKKHSQGNSSKTVQLRHHALINKNQILTVRDNQIQNGNLLKSQNSCFMDKIKIKKELQFVPKERSVFSNDLLDSETPSLLHSMNISHSQLLNNSKTFKLNQSQCSSFSKKQHKNQENPKLQTFFSQVETLRLKLYFKHICLNYCTVPKNATFSEVQNICNSIGLPEWMIYCKIFGITQKFKLFSIGIRKLSDLFKKYENIQRRINFDNFVFLLNEVVLQFLRIPKFNSSGDQKQTLRRLFQMIKIDSKLSQVCKLKQMGVNISEQCYSLPKLRKTVYSKSKFLNDSRVTERLKVSRSEHYSNTKVLHTSLHEKSKINEASNMRISKPMQRVNVISIKKMRANKKDIENIVGIFNDKEDKYLKQYLGCEERVKNGILKKLDNLSLSKKSRIQL